MPDPWQDAIKKYKVGDKVMGKVIKLLPFGAFVELDREIQGLVHVGELAEPAPKEVGEVLKEGETREFKIINIEPEEHRLGLSIKALTQNSVKEIKPEAKAEAPQPAPEKSE